MPPGPLRLHDDEGGGVGPRLGPFHVGERTTLHCEARGGEIGQEKFSGEKTCPDKVRLSIYRCYFILIYLQDNLDRPSPGQRAAAPSMHQWRQLP